MKLFFEPLISCFIYDRMQNFILRHPLYVTILNLYAREHILNRYPIAPIKNEMKDVILS